jgi:hypothetical protein
MDTHSIWKTAKFRKSVKKDPKRALRKVYLSQEDLSLKHIEQLLVCMKFRDDSKKKPGAFGGPHCNLHKKYRVIINNCEFTLSTRAMWNALRINVDYEVNVCSFYSNRMSHNKPFFNPTPKELYDFMDRFSTQVVLEDVMNT